MTTLLLWRVGEQAASLPRRAADSATAA